MPRIRLRLQHDLGYDLIGLSAPTMLMPCSLVPWFQEYEAQLGGTREIIRRKRPQRLSHGRLRRLTGKFSASCGQFLCSRSKLTRLFGSMAAATLKVPP